MDRKLEAAVRLKEATSLARAKELIREFGVNFVRDIPKEKEEAFISRCDSLSGSAVFNITVTDSEGCMSSFQVTGTSLSSALKSASVKAANLNFE